MVMSNKNVECQYLVQLQGFYKQSRLLAFTFVLGMLSIGGIPPMVGFFAKLGIIQELISLGWYKYTILLVLLSLVGVFVYLKIVKTVYFMEPNQDYAVYNKQPVLVQLILTKCVFLLLFISICPKHILNIVLQALGVF
jgi:NADH-quinone oxidoreductase subunit N